MPDNNGKSIPESIPELKNELQRLKKAARIRKYFKANDSADLKKFEGEKDSQKMEEIT